MSALRRTRFAALAGAGALLLSGCEFSVYSLPLPGGADLGDNPYEVTVAVPRRARPGAAVGGQGRRRVGRTGRRRPARRLHRRGDAAGPRRRRAARQRHRRHPPDQPARREVRRPRPAGDATPARTRSSDGDTIELEDTRPQPRGRGGARRPLAVPQRRRRRPAQDRHRGAQQGSRRSRGRGQVHAASLRDPHGGSRRRQGRHRPRPGERQLPGHLARTRRPTPSTWRWTSCRRPSSRSTASARTSSRCCRRWPRLSGVGTRVIQASKQGTIDSLNALAPVLTELAKSGDDLVNSLQIVLTFPFIDGVVGKNPQQARDLHMGDYTNLDIDLDLDLGEIITGRPAAADRPRCPPRACPTDILTNLPERRRHHPVARPRSARPRRRRRRRRWRRRWRRWRPRPARRSRPCPRGRPDHRARGA